MPVISFSDPSWAGQSTVAETKFGYTGPLKGRGYSLPPRTEVPFLGNSTLFDIQEGCVALFSRLHNGRRQILDVLGPGRVFGSMITDWSSCSAIVLSRTRLTSVVADENRAIILSAETRTMLRRTQDHALRLGQKTAYERVASALYELSKDFSSRVDRPKRKNVTFTLYLTRGDLADWLGLTLETVSRCIGGLKRSVIIDFRSPEFVTITDPERLISLAAGDTRLADTCKSRGLPEARGHNKGK